MNAASAEAIFDRRYQRWKLKRQRERKRLARRIYKTLATGGTVRESLAADHVAQWRAHDPAGVFIAEHATPGYLTRHLIARQGFGANLEFIACELA